MSTSETVTFRKGACPCGRGHVAQHVTTQDNPWSTADVAYSIECSACRGDWRLDGLMLVLRASEAGYKAAFATESQARSTLSTLVDQVINAHFANISLATKKAEHDEMVRIGIDAMTYRQYLEHRRRGGSIAEACSGLRNVEWLRAQAVVHSLAAQLEASLSTYRAACDASKLAASQIVRRKVA